MNINSQEWEGDRPCRFKGGKKIVKFEHDDFNPFEMNSKIVLRGLEQVKSKRHFQPKSSEILADWKPCVKMVKSASQSLRPIKLTEIPCRTHLKPLRHTDKFKKSLQPAGFMMNSISSKTLKDFKHQEEQNNVKNLEIWEKNTLIKRKIF
jgi:hypothetical protein